VVQRQEYFRFNGSIPGGTDDVGEPGPAKTAYSFAEGYTAGFSEFLTLQNPNTTSESVAVTLYMQNSVVSQQVVTVGPQTRVTLNINSIVVPIAQANPRATNEVSMASGLRVAPLSPNARCTSISLTVLRMVVRT